MCLFGPLTDAGDQKRDRKPAPVHRHFLVSSSGAGDQIGSEFFLWNRFGLRAIR